MICREVCELLLEYEADVDAVDKAGRTPLWAAASMGHAAVCELLLFWGAYVDHIDGEGRTVLSVAAAQVVKVNKLRTFYELILNPVKEHSHDPFVSEKILLG